MGYICGDRGTDKCPCVLMEAGQCYTCGMIKTGKCDCLSSWQGVCPYNEYIQNGCKHIGKARNREFEIKSVEDFSENLKVVTIGVPMGFALECSKMGTFLMIDVEGYKIPLSVMKSRVDEPSCIKLALYTAGPKTLMLDKSLEKGGKLKVTGPFLNGLVNSEKFDSDKLSLVIGKGMAIMPILNIENIIGGGMACMYLDESKLTQEFLEKYAAGLDYKRVEMDRDINKLADMICGDIKYCVEHTGEYPNIFLMVSPYYKQLITEQCCLSENMAIIPNHADMCCGEGMCGACSYTDEEGITVRMCKCTDMV